jgi:hypothetical protein
LGRKKDDKENGKFRHQQVFDECAACTKLRTASKFLHNLVLIVNDGSITPPGAIMSVFIGRGMLQSFSAFFLCKWGYLGCYFHIAAILVLFTIVIYFSLARLRRLPGGVVSWGNDHFFLPDGIFEIAG